MNEAPIILYTWKCRQTNQESPKIILRSMARNQNVYYDPENNAINLALLFEGSLPSNTLDYFYGKIADKLIEVFALEYSNQHVESWIRIAISELIEGDNK